MLDIHDSRRLQVFHCFHLLLGQCSLRYSIWKCCVPLMIASPCGKFCTGNIEAKVHGPFIEIRAQLWPICLQIYKKATAPTFSLHYKKPRLEYCLVCIRFWACGRLSLPDQQKPGTHKFHWLEEKLDSLTTQQHHFCFPDCDLHFDQYVSKKCV